LVLVRPALKRTPRIPMQVLIVETIPLLREALALILTRQLNTSAIALEATADTLLKSGAIKKADLLWLAGQCVEKGDQDLIKKIKKAQPSLKIVVFGVDDNIINIKMLFRQGICAYVSQYAAEPEIEKAITCVQSNTPYVPESLKHDFTKWLTESSSKKKSKPDITPREQEILKLIVDEYTTAEIAGLLFISHCTVETHRLHLIQKLGVKNTAGLVREAVTKQLCISI
jgi:DNA-binding NarL/FixJ family response regulator